MNNTLKTLIVELWRLPHLLASPVERASQSSPQSDGSSLTGDYNFRSDRFDCGMDPYGLYEDDL